MAHCAQEGVVVWVCFLQAGALFLHQATIQVNILRPWTSRGHLQQTAGGILVFFFVVFFFGGGGVLCLFIYFPSKTTTRNQKT